MNRLGSAVVHEICTNQVVVTLQAGVAGLAPPDFHAFSMDFRPSPFLSRPL